jgi:Double zinc ribbon/Prokaryotic RING finger family 2
VAPPLTRKVRDHSDDTGFQFEFFCDRCGKGLRSRLQTSSVGWAATILWVAGFVLGGRASRAGWGAKHLKDALRGPAWHRAFAQAIDEMRPSFRQCTRCSRWVCPETCWSEDRSLCDVCATSVAAAALNSPAKGDACAHCQARLVYGARFCASCGKPVAGAPAASFCTGCGGGMPAGSRFCPACGAAAPPLG